MKYRCCNCNFSFAVSEAIDGYIEGFKIGFLCPHCRANINELFFEGKKRRLHFESKKHKQWCSLLSIFGVLTFLIAFSLSGGSWLTFVATVFVILAYIWFGYWKWGFTPYPNIIGTQLVKE